MVVGKTALLYGNTMPTLTKPESVFTGAEFESDTYT
jgi:hypothetical protein